jgi:large subunit ribosomal protein L6
MSRIGNNPINVPEGVTVDIQPTQITVKGKLGELTQDYSAVVVKMENNIITVSRPSENKTVKAKHGLYRSLIANMLEGVSKGFTKELELVGVGYRASNQGQKLDLALGFSHNILFDIAPEVKIETISEKGKNPIIKLTSHDKQLVGYVASKIRSFRKPEPYKGKGVKYVGEYIRRKAIELKDAFAKLLMVHHQHRVCLYLEVIKRFMYN